MSIARALTTVMVLLIGERTVLAFWNTSTPMTAPSNQSSYPDFGFCAVRTLVTSQRNSVYHGDPPHLYIEDPASVRSNLPYIDNWSRVYQSIPPAILVTDLHNLIADDRFTTLQPGITITNYYWHATANPVVVGTVSVIIDHLNNTQTVTEFNSLYDASYIGDFPIRTDTNDAGTVTIEVPSGRDGSTTLAYPTLWSSPGPSITWMGYTPTGFCRYWSTSSPVPANARTLDTLPGETDNLDPLGWLWTARSSVWVAWGSVAVSEYLAPATINSVLNYCNCELTLAIGWTSRSPREVSYVKWLITTSVTLADTAGDKITTTKLSQAQMTSVFAAAAGLSILSVESSSTTLLPSPASYLTIPLPTAPVLLPPASVIEDQSSAAPAPSTVVAGVSTNEQAESTSNFLDPIIALLTDKLPPNTMLVAPAPAPASAAPLPPLILGSGSLIVTADATSAYEIHDQTLAPGGPAITISGTRYSLAAGGSEILIGSNTEVLVDASAGTEAWSSLPTSRAEAFSKDRATTSAAESSSVTETAPSKVATTTERAGAGLVKASNGWLRGGCAVMVTFLFGLLA